MRAAGVDKPASNLAIAYLKTQDRRRDPARRHTTRRARSPTTSWRRSPTGRTPATSAAPRRKNNLVNRLLATAAHDRARQGTVRRAGPDVRRRVPPGPRARRARRRCTCPTTDPRVVGRHRVADEAAVRERPVAGVPRRTRRRRARPAEPARRSPDPTPTAPRWPCRASRRGASSRTQTHACCSSLKAVQSSDGGFPFIAAAEPGVGPQLDRARDPGAHRREQRAERRRSGRRARSTPYTALRELPARLHEPGFGAFWFPASTSAERVRDRAVGSGDGGEEVAARAVDDVGRSLPLTPC